MQHRPRRHQRYAVDADVPRRDRVRRARPPVSTTFPVEPVDELVHAPSTCAWRLGVPAARRTRCTSATTSSRVTTTDTRFGVRAAVVLKLLRRSGRAGSERDAIVGAACRFHRAPYAVYAGFNAHVHVRGYPTAAAPAAVAAAPHPPLALPGRRPGRARASTRSSSSTWTRTDDQRPVTFTLDLEDHRRRPSRARALSLRSPDSVLDFLGDRGRARHVLRRRRDRRRAPRSRARGRGRRARDRPPRLAPPAAHRARPPTQLRADAKRGQGPARGARRRRRCSVSAPHCSRSFPSRAGPSTCSPRSASPTRRACCRPAARSTATRPLPSPPSGGRTDWSSSRARWRASPASACPTSAACTCARCPTPASAAARYVLSAGTSCSGPTATPTTSTPTRTFWVAPEVGRLGQPAALVQPPPHVRQGRGGAARRRRPAPRRAHRLARSRRRYPCRAVGDRVLPARHGASPSVGAARRPLRLPHRPRHRTARRARGLRRRRLPDDERRRRRLAPRASRVVRAASSSGSISTTKASTPRPRRAATTRTRSTAATPTPSAPSASHRPTWWSPAR